MLHVFHSNHVERLIDALTANIHQIRSLNPTHNIFEKIQVVVPNWNLETYIKFQIAQRAGIAANLHFQTLENFLASCIPTPQKSTTQIVSDKTITLLLLELLADNTFLAQPELRPIHSYLAAATPNTPQQNLSSSPPTPDSTVLRHYQLASQLARIFREYDYSRHEMLQSWLHETTIDKAPFDQVERWQRLLWLAVFGPEGRLAQLSEQHQTQFLRLSEVFVSPDTAPNTPPPISLELPDHTHIFGMSYVAPLFEKIFSQFKSRPEGVYFYTLTPCEEFWEDVRPGNDDEDDHALTTTTGFFDHERDTPALRRWARPGRDNNRMLNRLSETVHETRFFANLHEEIPQNLTLLQTLQEDIRQRIPEHPPLTSPTNNTSTNNTPDKSIQFLACPSIQREAEVIANEICHLIEQSDGTLRLNDIAVIVNHSQRELYQTHIRAAFKDTHDIAHNITDIAATTRFRLFEAIDLLFSLPFGDFKRRELLKLITHPNVMARENAPHHAKSEQWTEQWIAWCHDLNILHGADHTDHTETYIQADLYNWDQGMRRLTLGAFMSSTPNTNNTIFTTSPHQNYLPLEHSQTDLESSATLITLVRSLIADARFSRDNLLPLADWTTLMSRMLSTYIGHTDSSDANELLRCHQILAEIQDLDITNTPIPYRVAYQFMRDALDLLESQSGQYLVDGVVVTSFLPMRPIPFKIVFVTGMGEGKFPLPDRQNPLDLKLAKWHEGDVRTREQDKYMFLETLISTRQRLYLSWVSRDNRTGDPLEPSSVVKELQYILAGYETPETLAKRLIEHPLRRYDRAYFPKFYNATDLPNTLPQNPLPAYGHEAHQEAILNALHQNLQSFATTNNIDFPDPKKLQQYTAPEIWQNIHTRLRSIDTSAALPTLSTPTNPQNTQQSPIKISLPIYALQRFLECPLQASARFTANLYDFQQPDLFASENERFETDRSPQRHLLTNVFMQFTAPTQNTQNTSPQTLENLYDAHAQHLELLGTLPTGIFKDAERRRHLNILKNWTRNLQSFGLNNHPTLHSLQFGSVSKHHANPHTLLHPSIRLHIPAVPQPDGTKHDLQVDLVGNSQALNTHRNLSVTLLNRKATETRDFLPGFFDHILLAATDLLPPNTRPNTPHTVFLNPSEPLPSTHAQTRQFHPITPQAARDYLTLLTRDLLSGVHDYLLPFETVIHYTDPRNSDAFANILANQREQKKSISSLYGPVRRLQNFAPPDESLTQTLINTRFAPFLKPVEEVKETENPEKHELKA